MSKENISILILSEVYYYTTRYATILNLKWVLQ